MSEGKPTRYEPIAVSAESTVVAEFIPERDQLVGLPVRGRARERSSSRSCSRRRTSTCPSRPRPT